MVVSKEETRKTTESRGQRVKSKQSSQRQTPNSSTPTPSSRTKQLPIVSPDSKARKNPSSSSSPTATAASTLSPCTPENSPVSIPPPSEEVNCWESHYSGEYDREYYFNTTNSTVSWFAPNVSLFLWRQLYEEDSNDKKVDSEETIDSSMGWRVDDDQQETPVKGTSENLLSYMRMIVKQQPNQDIHDLAGKDENRLVPQKQMRFMVSIIIFMAMVVALVIFPFQTSLRAGMIDMIDQSTSIELSAAQTAPTTTSATKQMMAATSRWMMGSGLLGPSKTRQRPWWHYTNSTTTSGQMTSSSHDAAASTESPLAQIQPKDWKNHLSLSWVLNDDEMTPSLMPTRSWDSMGEQLKSQQQPKN